MIEPSEEIQRYERELQRRRDNGPSTNVVYKGAVYTAQEWLAKQKEERR